MGHRIPPTNDNDTTATDPNVVAGGKRPKRPAPLPVRDGLNPSRVRVPDDAPLPLRAQDFVAALIATQRFRHPDDDERALLGRFSAGEVVGQHGEPFAPDDLLKPGVDVWFYRIPAPETPVPYDIKVIHEDDRLLVVDKPPFLATFPRGSHITESVLVRMRRETGNQELSPAHRLDRLTSGVLVLTKSQRWRGAYQELFARREVDKVYEATAPAEANITAGTVWEHRMEKERGEFKTRIVDGPINARTVVEEVTPLPSSEEQVLQRLHGVSSPLSRYTLHPLTGRTHQLRLHMYLAGAPILGDPVYPDVLPVDAEDFAVPMHLLSRRLTFVDPISGDFRSFESSR
ncbi:pseudouridine synthase [Corynebacterium epidermidicanis]|nr:pseudouridine synthase [Corynebacterium epidermidicanis]